VELLRFPDPGIPALIDQVNEAGNVGPGDPFLGRLPQNSGRLGHDLSSAPMCWLLAGYSGRICGNRITSRIEALSVNSITRRSIPMPSPAVGGRPYSRART